jgi:hypothetical protein
VSKVPDRELDRDGSGTRRIETTLMIRSEVREHLGLSDADVRAFDFLVCVKRAHRHFRVSAVWDFGSVGDVAGGCRDLVRFVSSLDLPLSERESRITTLLGDASFRCAVMGTTVKRTIRPRPIARVKNLLAIATEQFWSVASATAENRE